MRKTVKFFCFFFSALGAASLQQSRHGAGRRKNGVKAAEVVAKRLKNLLLKQHGSANRAAAACRQTRFCAGGRNGGDRFGSVFCGVKLFLLFNYRFANRAADSVGESRFRACGSRSGNGFLRVTRGGYGVSRVGVAALGAGKCCEARFRAGRFRDRFGVAVQTSLNVG